MNIEDLKSLMDDFDPASLLPELDSIMGWIQFIVRLAVVIGPVVLLVMGLAYLFMSPKEANYYFGYRCFFGMGSVEAWRFSQRLAGIVWGLLGLVLTIVMVLVGGGFQSMETMDMLWKAVRCLLWEAGLTAVSCLVINTVVASYFDGKGGRRRKKHHAKKGV